MNQCLRLAGLLMLALLPFGCATAPEPVFVTEAQQVTTRPWNRSILIPSA
jgi:hypothetical protein